jgi:hypothetical protein
MAYMLVALATLLLVGTIVAITVAITLLSMSRRREDS